MHEKIIFLCNSKGISVNVLERKLGFGAGTISKWRTSSPALDKAVKVADYFSVSLDWLAGRNVEMSNKEE